MRKTGMKYLWIAFFGLYCVFSYYILTFSWIAGEKIKVDESAAFQVRARECNYQTSLLASATDKRFWSKQMADRAYDFCLQSD